MQQPFFVGQPMSPQMQPVQPMLPMGVPQMMTQDGQMMMTMLPNGMLVPTAQLGFPADLEGQKKAAPDGVDMGEVCCPFTRGVRVSKRSRCTAFVWQAFCGTCCVGVGVMHVTVAPCTRTRRAGGRPNAPARAGTDQRR